MNKSLVKKVINNLTKGKIKMTKTNEKLKKVLTENLHNLNRASSQTVINEMYEAMKADQIHNKADKFDKEKFRNYCWKLADYSGEQVTVLGDQLKDRNTTFERNVNLAIDLYYTYLHKGDDFKLSFKNNRFMIPQKYIDGESKEAQKNPEKSIPMPSNKIKDVSGFVVDGTYPTKTTKGKTLPPEMIDVVTEAINNFAESILSKNLVSKGNINYQELNTKFNDSIVQKLETHKNFISLLIQAYRSSVIAYNKSKGEGKEIEFIPDSRVLTTQMQEFKEYTPKYLFEVKAK